MLVVLYGKIWEDWKGILSQTSTVWADLSYVERVLLVEEFEFPLTQVASKYSETVLIPLKEQGILEHPQGYKTLIPSEELVNTASYKNLFYELLSTLGLKEHYPQELSSPDFSKPFIVKRLHGESGLGVFLVWDEPRYNLILQQQSLKNHPFVLQEYIEGDDEYVFYVVCKGGEVLWHASLVGQPPIDSRVQKGSFANASEIEISEEVYKVFEGICEALNYEGPATFNYKLKDGKPIIFEMNPRMGGSMMKPKFRHLVSGCMKAITLNAYLKE
jgi:carbamoylphosphate synthase large subunit